MCTLISQITSEGLLLGMNRDCPLVKAHSDYRSGDIFYPLDPGSNGTWMGMRKDGTIVALLNRHHKDDPKTSRGNIVPKVLEGKLDLENLQTEDLEKYPSFALVQYSHKEKKVGVLEWVGKNKTLASYDQQLLLASSGLGYKDVKLARLQSIAPETIDRGSLEKLLSDHSPEPCLSSLCMHEPIVGTTASTIIQIKNDIAEVYDLKGNPCSGKYEFVYRIELVKGFSSQ